MGLALKSLLDELETLRKEGGGGVRVDVVRTLEVPLDLESCRELRVLAQVFSDNPSLLASVVLRAALQDMQQHLDDDLDRMAEAARQTMDEDCREPWEVI